jgi:hypothetical protein
MKNIGGNRYQLENGEKFSDYWVPEMNVADPEIVKVESQIIDDSIFVQFQGESSGNKVGVPLSSLDETVVEVIRRSIEG